MPTSREFILAVLDALGLDADGVRSIEVRAHVGGVPEVVVTRLAPGDAPGAVAEVMARYQLFEPIG